MNDHSPFEWLFVSLAAIAGAMTSLTFRPYKTMLWWEIALAFTVSLGFALSVGPLVAEFSARSIVRLLGGDANGPVNLRIFGAVMWLLAASSHVVIPVLIRRAKDKAANWNGSEASE